MTTTPSPADAPRPDRDAHDEPVIADPVADPFAPADPVVDEPAANEPVAYEPAADEPAFTEPAFDEAAPPAEPTYDTAAPVADPAAPVAEPELIEPARPASASSDVDSDDRFRPAEAAEPAQPVEHEGTALPDAPPPADVPANSAVVHDEHAAPADPASATAAYPAAAAAPAAAAPTAAQQQVVYVDAPRPPRKHTNRGIGALVVLLGAGIFAAVYGAFVLLVGVIAPPANASSVLQFFATPTFWLPVVVFFFAYLLLVIVSARAGWWVHVLGGFIVALLVYISFIGAVLITTGTLGGTAAVQQQVILSQLSNPLAFAAAIAAREVPIWVGGIVARRGRKMTARNAEERATYDEELAAHRARLYQPTGV